MNTRTHTHTHKWVIEAPEAWFVKLLEEKLQARRTTNEKISVPFHWGLTESKLKGLKHKRAKPSYEEMCRSVV